jgi:hypothetical protein
MKYRMLTSEELTHLEEELKQFLIINHVYKEEWERMNRDTPETAQDLVGLFSDQVLQRVYENISYLEHRSKDAWLVFNLGKDTIEMIGLQKKDTETDGVTFETPESIHEALTVYPKQVGFFKHTKAYTKQREEEIHQMIEQGCVKSSDEFWKLLLEVVD